MKCRHCNSELEHTFIDLGSSPPSNSYLTETTLKEPEKCYPLRVLVCDYCWLVQTADFVGAGEMFSDDYAYFSSFSDSWLRHASSYVESMVELFQLNSESRVVEIAANDGYLLQFVEQKNIPCYGIEPTNSTAEAARKKGIEIIEEFFCTDLAEQLVARQRQADLIVANNVLAHVPDINNFVRSFSILLKPTGVATFEFPHLMNLVDKIQFDTIYHEHYSYLSLTSVVVIFQKAGLSVFDVEQLPTHGGSLRVYAQRSDTSTHAIKHRVGELLKSENNIGLTNINYYQGFQKQVENIKCGLLEFLHRADIKQQKVVAYGAAAKGNTLLNFAGVKSELIQYVVDKNPAKQNKFMPGSRIPIVSEEYLIADKPDLVLILPWNLNDEIIEQLHYIKEWGGKFVTVGNWKII